MRAAALYFLHPVEHGADSQAPRCVSIHCLSESTGPKNIRPDIVYRKNGRNFALLEYKIIGVVDWTKFNEARLAATASPNVVREMREKAEDKKFETFFEGKALKIIKQMRNYSKDDEQSTQYIAMFNWDWLFMSIFNSDEEVVHGTLAHRNGSQRNRFRKALLGWLLEAHDNDGQSTLKAPDRGGATGSST